MCELALHIAATLFSLVSGVGRDPDPYLSPINPIDRLMRCFDEPSKDALQRSEDPLRLVVDLFKGDLGALIKDHLRGQALIFIVVVCIHASSELVDIVLAPLAQDGLAGRTLILSGEAIL